MSAAILARLEALASGERICQHAKQHSRQERACHKAAAEAYEVAIELLRGQPERCPHCGSDDICDEDTVTYGPPVAPGVTWCGSCGRLLNPNLTRRA